MVVIIKSNILSPTSIFNVALLAIIIVLAVHKNVPPIMIGTWRSSIMSMMIKSVGI